jgi:hypothetical protein
MARVTKAQRERRLLAVGNRAMDICDAVLERDQKTPDLPHSTITREEARELAKLLDELRSLI